MTSQTPRPLQDSHRLLQETKDLILLHDPQTLLGALRGPRDIQMVPLHTPRVAEWLLVPSQSLLQLQDWKWTGIGFFWNKDVETGVLTYYFPHRKYSPFVADR